MSTTINLDQLNADFVKATKVEIFGQRSASGFNGLQRAPRSRGYEVSFVPHTRKIVVRRNGGKDSEWSLVIDIDQVGSIQIWTKKSGPNIAWERGTDGQLRRVS